VTAHKIGMHHAFLLCLLWLTVCFFPGSEARSQRVDLKKLPSTNIRQGRPPSMSSIVTSDYLPVKEVATQQQLESNLPLSQARRLLVGVSSLYALDYSVNKVLQRQLKPEVVSALKYSLAALYFLPSFLRCQVNTWSLRVGVELGLWCSMYAITLTSNLATTKASKVSFFAAFGVILAPIYDHIASYVDVKQETGEEKDGGELGPKKKQTTRTHVILSSPFIAPLLAIAGVALLEFDFSDIASIRSVRLGSGLQDLKLLASPVASSLCYWRSARLSRRRPYDVTVAATTMMATVGLLSSSICVYKYGAPSFLSELCDVGYVKGVMRALASASSRANTANKIFQTVREHGSTCGLVLVSSLLATGWSTLTEQRALRVLSAAQAALVLSMEPLFATFYAWLLLGEKVGLNTAVAACCIVAASLWGPFVDYLREKRKLEESKTS